MCKLFGLSLALSLAAPMAALADSADELRGLRGEIESVRADYEARLQALEQRLRAAEAALAASSSATPRVTASAPSAAAAAPPMAAATLAPPTLQSQPQPQPQPPQQQLPLQVPPPPGNAAPATANAFNPALSLVLSGIYSRTTRDPASSTITGFRLPANAEVGLGARGLRLAESELGLAASIDPWWRGAANFALHGDNSVAVEEAFVQTTALGRGMSLKAGRFLSGIGYLNSQHAHAWDFVDNPLAYQALLGTQYGDDGLQLTWLAPLDGYLELGAELGRGRSFPGSDSARNGAGMRAVTAHTGGDIGASHSWRAGASLLQARAEGQALTLGNSLGNSLGGSQGESRSDMFNGSTRVWVIDAVWKWAPEGNATRTNFKLQGEWLRSTRSGSLAPLDAASYRATSSGGYVQAIYQFMPAWRVGLRAERLTPAAPDAALTSAPGTATIYRPSKPSLMLDYSASEFSRLRLQWARDRSREGLPDTQISLQYQMSLGAHGAHAY